mmetsp:Transcript_18310/g.50482  ORF Transcript_18310/g.50482 Transcript_18310/m.50482 type:complete len:85 (+) Transcript_18310:494-748(+)
MCPSLTRLLSLFRADEAHRCLEKLSLRLSGREQVGILVFPSSNPPILSPLWSGCVTPRLLFAFFVMAAAAVIRIVFLVLYCPSF